MTREDIKTIIDIVHDTIYGFFDVCDDEEETPMTDKDKLLLKINKAICTNIKALEQESCENAVSRQAALDAMYELCNIGETLEENPWRDNPHIDAIIDAINNLPPVNLQKPSGDLISRQATIEAFQMFRGYEANRTNAEWVDRIETIVKKLPPINPQEPKTGQFAKWVATEIFDDNWEYNKDAFAELACRKLAELGIVRAKGEEWELVDSQESEDEA